MHALEISIKHEDFLTNMNKLSEKNDISSGKPYALEKSF